MRRASDIILSRFAMEVGTACFTGGVGTIVAIGSMPFGVGWGDAGPQAGYFPFYVGLIIILASGGILIQALLKHKKRKEAFLTYEQGARVLSFFGPMTAFVILTLFLGLYVALIIYLLGVMVFQGQYKWPKAIVISLGSAVLFYFVFEVWFQVPLLKGPLEPLLGIQ